MVQRNAAWWLVPLLGIWTLVVPLKAVPPESAPDDRQASSEAPPAENTECLPSGTKELLCEFLGLPCAFVGEAEVKSSLSSAGYNVDSIIATVPDPVDSHYAYNFDRYLDAIQRAAEQAGYSLDRYRLLWPRKKDDKDAKQGRCSFISQPSLLLFRKGKSLLLVFLVGETPTAGAHKVALQAAFEQAAALRLESDPRFVKLLGPSFSGSLVSVKRAFENWCHSVTGCSGAKLQMISGTATAIDPGDERNWVDYRSMVPLDKVTTERFLSYLRDSGVGSEKVAMLVEANTDYGRLFCRLLQPEGVASFPFPLHISQLRDAHNKERMAQATTGGKSPLSLESFGEPIDVMHPFSPLEVHTTEMVLARILRRIDQEGFHYVGLLASDISDRLFLAEKVRQYAPNVRLFTLSSDLLYTHPGESPYLRGMLVVTPYSLFSWNRMWAPPFAPPLVPVQSRLQFPSSNAQGVYNAMLALLGEDEYLLERRAPVAPEDSVEPPIWLMTVGWDDVWPVKLLSGSDGTKPPEIETVPQSADSVLVVLALTFIALIVVAKTLWTKRLPADLRLLSTLENPVFNENRLDGHAHRLALLSALTAVYVLVAATFILPVRFAESNIYLYPTLGATAVLLLAATGVAAKDAFRALTDHPRNAPRVDHVTAHIVIVGSFLVVGLALTTLLQWVTFPVPEQLFLHLRAATLGSGVSVLLPALCLGAVGVLWALSMLTRLRLEEGAPRIVLKLGENSFVGIATMEERIRASLSFGFHSFSFWPLTFPVAALLAFLLCRRLVPTVEGRAFDAFFCVGFLLTNYSIFLTLVRCAWLWRDLLKLLRRLAGHRMVEAYRRLPGNLTWSPPLGWSGQPRSLADVECAVERARLFQREIEQSPEALTELEESIVSPLNTWGARVDEVRATLKSALIAHAEGNWRQATELRLKVQETLTEMTEPVVRFLEHRPPASSLSENDSREPVIRRGEDFVASRIAGFIRLVLTQIRNLTGFVMAGLVLLLLTITSYPFEPKQTLLTAAWLVILFVVAWTLVMFVQMERNMVLSYLSNTDPGRVNWSTSFAARIFTYGVVPVLSLLIAQFPELGGGLAGWVEQSLTALRGSGLVGP